MNETEPKTETFGCCMSDYPEALSRLWIQSLINNFSMKFSILNTSDLGDGGGAHEVLARLCAPTPGMSERSLTLNRIAIVDVESEAEEQLSMGLLRCSACVQLFLVPLTMRLPLVCPFEDMGAVVMEGALCTFEEKDELNRSEEQ